MAWYDNILSYGNPLRYSMPGAGSAVDYLSSLRFNKADSPNNYDQLGLQIMIQAMAASGYNVSPSTNPDGTISWSVTPKPDPRVQVAIDQYGSGSPEAIAAQQSVDSEKIKQAEQDAQIRDWEFDAMQRYYTGEAKLFPEQETFLNEQYDRQAAIGAVGYNAIRDEINRTNSSIGQYIDDYVTQAQNTGMSADKMLQLVGSYIDQTGQKASDFLKLAETRIGQTNETVGKALEASFNQARELSKMGLEDQAEQLQADISRKAVLLGRNPTDPEFQREFLKTTQDNIVKVNYMLGIDEAQKRAGLASDTGAKLENLAYQYAGLEERLGAARAGLGYERAGLAERTGGKLEQAQLMRAQLAESTGKRRESVAGSEADYLRALGAQREASRYSLAFGRPQDQAQFALNQQQVAAGIRSQNIADQMSIFQNSWAPYQAETDRLQYVRDWWDIIDTAASTATNAASVAAVI